MKAKLVWPEKYKLSFHQQATINFTGLVNAAERISEVPKRHSRPNQQKHPSRLRIYTGTCLLCDFLLLIIVLKEKRHKSSGILFI